MRILVATDGSAAARTACAVVASTAWPAGSSIRIVTVMPRSPVVLGFDLPGGTPIASVTPGLPSAEILRAARDSMARRRDVDIVLLEGRPASAILTEAREFDADLIVVGSRGHGPWQTMLLGSVSAEVVDHAPCPVLVIRGRELDPIVLATDGSDDARRAEDLLAHWPLAAGASVQVVTAAHVQHPLETGFPVALGDELLASYEHALEESRSECRRIAQASAMRLAAAGIRADVEVEDGDAAAVIVEAARRAGAGLIVIGTRGHGGITRILLGSVARNVLLHAPCSVLVVRPTARRARRKETAASSVAVALSATR